ncbi:MAG: hypothetical protein Kow00105_14950 [Phycisphaeraceae bacterium]
MYRRSNKPTDLPDSAPNRADGADSMIDRTADFLPDGVWASVVLVWLLLSHESGSFG